MGERGHEATADAYAAWATSTMAAPPEVVIRHLVEPDLLARWVPGAEAVTLDGATLRMELWTDPRAGQRATFVTRSQVVDALRVERSWAVERVTGRIRDQVVASDVQRCAVAYTLVPTGDGTAVTVRVATDVPGIRTRVTRPAARAQARSLDLALARLARIADGRRPWSLRSVVVVGPL